MPSKYAYITLVMKGDAYVPGALIMGYSLKRISSLDRLVMVTDDVTLSARNTLSKIFKVISVSYIEHVARPAAVDIARKKKLSKMTNFKDVYASWIDVSHTKWNMLNIGKYKKILFLDADMIILNNIDAIFNLDTPAGMFISPHAYPYKKEFGFKDYYREIPLGGKIKLDVIDRATNGEGAVAIGTPVMLTPNKDHFNDFLTELKADHLTGYNVHSGADEQSITYFYHRRKITWTSLPPNMNTIPWPNLLSIIQRDYTVDKCNNSKRGSPTLCDILTRKCPVIIHYFGSKNVWDSDPWSNNIYPDTYPFWSLVSDYICRSKHRPHEISKLKTLFLIKKRICKDKLPVPECCFWSKYLGKSADHHFLRQGKIVCPDM